MTLPILEPHDPVVGGNSFLIDFDLESSKEVVVWSKIEEVSELISSVRHLAYQVQRSHDSIYDGCNNEVDRRAAWEEWRQANAPVDEDIMGCALVLLHKYTDIVTKNCKQNCELRKDEHNITLRPGFNASEASIHISKLVQGLSNYFKHHQSWTKENWDQNDCGGPAQRTIDFAKKNVEFDSTMNLQS